MEDITIYLRPTQAIDSDHPAIREKTEELVRDCVSEADKAVRLFNLVRDSIRFNAYMVSAYFEDFVASKVLERGKGYCAQKAVLLAALGRSAGIPSRLCFAKIRNHRAHPDVVERLGTNIFSRHGYNQFYLEGKWLTVSPTFDKQLCEKNRLPVVSFDGLCDAVQPETDLNGNPFIEYMEIYGPQADLPFEWIQREVAKFWGPEKRAWLSSADAEGYRTPRQH